MGNANHSRRVELVDRLPGIFFKGEIRRIGASLPSVRYWLVALVLISSRSILNLPGLSR
jgi:hypothetical protein